MKIARRTGAMVSGAALLLSIMSSDALGQAQVYKAQMQCDGGADGTAQIRTLVNCAPGPPRFCEPFFRVLATLTDLPNLPVEQCEVTLTCEGSTALTFDCALDLKPHSLGFNSGDMFLGALPGGACHEPAVRVAVTYTGASRRCTPGF